MAAAASNVLIYIAMVAAFNSETSSSVFDGSIDLACPGALVKVDGPFIIRSSSALWVACEEQRKYSDQQEKKHTQGERGGKEIYIHRCAVSILCVQLDGTVSPW